MVGLRRPAEELPMYTYLGNEQILKNLQQNKIDNATPEATKMVNDINNACEQLKATIIAHDINTTSIPEDFEQRKIVLNEKLADLRDTYKSTQLLAEIKAAVINYNASTADNKIATEHSILSMVPEQLAHTTNLFILNSLTQLQIQLAMKAKSKNAGTTLALN